MAVQRGDLIREHEDKGELAKEEGKEEAAVKKGTGRNDKERKKKE